MKNCPACGAEVEEGDKKCHICDYIFKVEKEQAEEPPKISNILDDVRKRIQNLRESSTAQGIDESSEAAIEKESADSTDAKDTSDEPIEEEIPRTEIAPESPEPIGFDEPHIEVFETEVEADDIDVFEESEVIGEEEFPLQEEIVEIPVKQVEEPEIPVRMGYKISPTERIVEKRRGANGKKVAAAIAVAAILIFASWFFFFNEQDPIVLRIDGDFREWDDVTTYDSLSFFESDNEDIIFLDCGVQYQDEQVFWYFATWEELYFHASQVTSYSLLIDADGKANTGFSLLEYFGADVMATISGSGGTRLSESVSIFTDGDQLNWSAWSTTLTSLTVAAQYDQAETSFPVPLGIPFSEEDARFVAVSYDGVSIPSMTPVFALEPGVLVVTQNSRIQSATSVVPQSPGEEIMLLYLSGYGEVYPVLSVDPVMTNLTMSGSLSAPWNHVNDIRVGTYLIVMSNTEDVAIGAQIGAEVTPDSFITEYPSVMVIGRPAIGYINQIPANITIDGCFADWSLLRSDQASVAVTNDDINLTFLAQELHDDQLSFYVEVLGDILAGTFIPVGKSIAGPNKTIIPSPNTDIRVTGEDIFRIYIDLDPSADTGAQSPAEGGEIEPDFLIEISGKNGIVTQTALYSWNANWTLESVSAVSTATDGKRIEIGISQQDLGDLSEAMFLVESEDWKGNKDYTQEFDISISS